MDLFLPLTLDPRYRKSTQQLYKTTNYAKSIRDCDLRLDRFLYKYAWKDCRNHHSLEQFRFSRISPVYKFLLFSSNTFWTLPVIYIKMNPVSLIVFLSLHLYYRH